MRRGTLAALSLLLAAPGATAELAVGAGATFDLGSGVLDLGCGDLDVSGIFAAGTGSASGVRDLAIAPGGTLQGERGSIELAGSWDNSGSFVGGTASVAFVDGCGTSSASVFGDTTFGMVSFVTSAGKTVFFEAGSTQTVTGALTLDGDPGARLVIRSTQAGSEAFLDVSGSQTVSAVDVQDNHAVGSLLFVDPASVLGTNTVGWAFPGLVPSLSAGGTLLLALLLLGSGLRRLRARRPAQRPALFVPQP